MNVLQQALNTIVMSAQLALGILQQQACPCGLALQFDFKAS